MNALLTGFMKTSGQDESHPSMNDLLCALAQPAEYPEAQRYLQELPRLKASLLGVVRSLAAESKRAIAENAYYRSLARARYGIHGDALQDWLAAEVELAEYYHFEEQNSGTVLQGWRAKKPA